MVIAAEMGNMLCPPIRMGHRHYYADGSAARAQYGQQRAASAAVNPKPYTLNPAP